jgi:hypothetical protein
MILDEKVYTALKILVDSGVVREVRTERHARYVEANALLEATAPDLASTNVAPPLRREALS